MINPLIKIIVTRHNQYLLASRTPNRSDRVRANEMTICVELEYILNTYCTAAGIPNIWYFCNDGTIALYD